MLITTQKRYYAISNYVVPFAVLSIDVFGRLLVDNLQ